MINLHIRKDFQKWLIPSDNARTMAVCGAKTSGKYAGVPGVTDQSAFVTEAGEFGWCLHCCGQALDIMNKVMDDLNNERLIMHPKVRDAYFEAMVVTVAQIVQANSWSATD